MKAPDAAPPPCRLCQFQAEIMESQKFTCANTRCQIRKLTLEESQWRKLMRPSLTLADAEHCIAGVLKRKPRGALWNSCCRRIAAALKAKAGDKA